MSKIYAESDRMLEADGFRAPGKPKSAFHIFMHGKMAVWKEKDPSLDLVALSKEASKQWRSMTEADKDSYREKKKELQILYERDLAVYEEARRLHEQAQQDRSVSFLGSFDHHRRNSYDPQQTFNNISNIDRFLTSGYQQNNPDMQSINRDSLGHWQNPRGPPADWTPSACVKRWSCYEQLIAERQHESLAKTDELKELHREMGVYQVQLTDRKTKMLERLKMVEGALGKFFYAILHRILVTRTENALLEWALLFNPPEFIDNAIRWEFVKCSEEELALRLIAQLRQVKLAEQQIIYNTSNAGGVVVQSMIGPAPVAGSPIVL